MSITTCKHCNNQYDQDTDVEHEEVCQESMDTKTQQIIQHGFDTLLEVHKEDLRMQKKINDKIEEINKQLEDITHSLETIDIKTIR